MTELRVRYQTDDAAASPVAGATVHFSIFKDPAGSTLTRDAATTARAPCSSKTWKPCGKQSPGKQTHTAVRR